MPRRSTQNQKALNSLDSFTDQFVSALNQKVAYDSIIDFACHPSFCGRKLYPRQGTLLKLIYLETEHMTPYDIDVIEEWRNNFSSKGKYSYGVQPDIWKRIEYLKSRGYRHFPHIQSIMGRRASKGFIGGILGAEKLSYLISLDNWQEHYGIQNGKDGYLSVIATNILQSKKFLFADIRDTVTGCQSLKKYISETTNEYKLHLRTPADLRHIAEMAANKTTIEHEIATLRVHAMTSTSSSGRGGVGFCLDPGTPVLTADLRWIPIQDVQIDDELIGIDEIPEWHCQRKIRKTKVTGKCFNYKSAYRINFSDGTSVVCSDDHPWLVLNNPNGNYYWRKIKDSSPFTSIGTGTQIAQLIQPWEEDTLWEASFLTVISIEELPEQRLVDIETDSHTFIANGLVSHNCNMFDEFAHLLTTTDGPRSSQEIYEAYQPALDEFGKDSLTYIPSSPYTQIGYFYNLYVYGSVLMQDYIEELAIPTPIYDSEGKDPEEKFSELTSDPEMLIVQLPSWELYRDWERGEELCGVKFKKAHQAYDERMKRLEKRNPTKFKVERRAQFAEVQEAYLDPDKVDQMFEVFWEDRVLEQQEIGTLAYIYEGHSDPGRSNANFAVCIAHLEQAPLADEYGQIWSHVIIDHLHVWKPQDYEDRIVDYVKVEKDLEILISHYPALRIFSFDAWNSGAFIALLKEKFRNKPKIIIEPFNDKKNQQRAEYFKSALNLGWVHSFKDNFFGEGQSLLETELKFLTEVNGKVEKQTIGPCTTKDLADTVMVVTHRLLHQQLDQWQKSLLGTVSLSKALPSGKIIPTSSSNIVPRQWLKFERGTARARLESLRDGKSRTRRSRMGR